MRKIIFEQVSNILLLSLLMITLVQSIPTAYFDANGFYVKFGPEVTIFLVVLIITGICRFIYSTYGKKEGYSFSKGEYSARDEREEKISHHATTVTYKMLTGILTFAIGILFISMMGINDLILLKQTAITILCSVLIIALVTYLIAWIIFDKKM